MSAIRNKQRLIHLYRYLMQYTDEEHQATTNDLVEFLRQEDANASRKTVKDDIEVLIEEGVDVVVTKSFYNSYFIGSRKFEMPEIKLLADGITPNRSVSKEKKEEIIGKLLSMLSVYEAEKIGKHLHYENNTGTMSEQLYYNIDRITNAIDGNRKIEFIYSGQIPPGVASGEKTGRIVMTPVVVRSYHNHYYVCGYCGQEEKAAVFRIDRMIRTQILNERGRSHPDRQRIDRFLKSLYGMELGEIKDVTLECRDEVSDVIGERIGEDAEIWRSTSESFYIKVPVSVSSAFFGWVFSFGGKVRIISPASVRDEYVRRAVEIVRESGKQYYDNSGQRARPSYRE